MFSCPPPPPRLLPAADRPRYALNVVVQRGFRRVDGDLTVRFTANRPTRRLVFRLWPNGPLQLHAGSRLTVGRATSAGRVLSATSPDPTTLVLAAPLGSGESITVQLPWHLTVPRASNDRIARFGHGVRLGTFFPLLAWDPRRGWVRDPPARILAESATSPVADFDVHVTVPHGSRAFVTGSPVGPHHWRARGVRDVALAAGRFRVATGVLHAPNPVTLRVAVAGGAQVPRDVLSVARRDLRQLALRYGPYPWSSYTVVATPDLGAEGIEFPTLSFIGRASIVTLLINHETAHQWFYSLVGNDQARDPWLDEALATWAQVELAGMRPSDFGPPGFRHVGASVYFFTGHVTRYFQNIYTGGVQALASLAPANRVDCALRLYVARNAFRIAQPGDLLDALNRVIPGAERRLRAFGIHRA